MAERRLPGARAKAGRSLATLRPPPDNPAGIVLTNGQDDQEQPAPAEPEQSLPPVEHTTQQVRGEAVSDNPQRPRTTAASTAATEAIAMPLLGQVGQSLLTSKQINPALIARQQRRQHLVLLALQRAVEALGPGGSISEVHAQLDSYGDYERLREAALACYRLAAESFQVTRALFTPVLRAAGEARSTGTAELEQSAAQTTDPDPWVERVQVVDVEPDSESGQTLVNAGRAAIVHHAEQTPPEVPAMVSVETADLRVVAERRVPALAGGGAQEEPEEPEVSS
jgi:hypothetical protein